MAARDPAFSQLYDNLTELYEALSSDSESEGTKQRARSCLRENENAIRESFLLWAKLGRDGRNHLLERHRQLDAAAANDDFLSIAENALETALDVGPLRAPVTDDDVNMIRRVVNYAAFSPDAERS